MKIDATSLARAAALCALGSAAAGFSVGTQPTAAQSFQVGVREIWSAYGDPGWGEPRGMVQWPDGTVWVGDSQASEVWEISADGAESRRVLREGEGPGELKGVSWIVPYQDGGVVVADARGFLFFGADKRFVRQVKMGAFSEQAGVVATPDGDLVVSGGFRYEDHDLARHAVHRIDRKRGWHVKSWHPAAGHPQWETVRVTSGGPIAPASDGGLWVSDHAPFRITRYSDLMGGGARLLIQDEDVVSASERERAVTYRPGGYGVTTRWTRSIFVHEMEDGNVLNVVKAWPEDGGASGEWLVVSPDGRLLARTPVAKSYNVWSATPDGHYLASYWDDRSLQMAVAKLEVAVASTDSSTGGLGRR